MILFISIIVALAAFAVFYRKYVDRFSRGGIQYNVEIDRGEVFEGEYFTLRETVTNDSAFPVSAVRVDLNLPEGLEFVVESSGSDEKRTPYISGLFSLKSRESTSRTWRVFARHRGIYTVDRAIIVKRALFGLDKLSERIDLSAAVSNSVVVYPEIIDLREYFTTSRLVTGNALSRARLVRDPLMISGVRAYTTDDPMNRVNWKVSAAHGSLYVNNEEFSEKYELDVLLNMQSRSRERTPDTIAYPENVDLCVNVTAAILDKCTANDIPVSIITNGRIDSPIGFTADTRDGGIFHVTPTATGRDDIFGLIRYLAGLQTAVCAPTYDMLEQIAASPARYLRGRNLVVVTAYFDAFFVKFHEQMTAQGYSIVYYITTAYKEAVEFPIDAEIHYKTRKTEAAYE